MENTAKRRVKIILTALLSTAMATTLFYVPNSPVSRVETAFASNWTYTNGQGGTFIAPQTGKYRILVRGSNGYAGATGFRYYYSNGANGGGTYQGGYSGGSAGLGYSKDGFATLSKGSGYSYRAGGSNGGNTNANYNGWYYTGYSGWLHSDTTSMTNSCWGNIYNYNTHYQLYPGAGGAGGAAAYFTGGGINFGASGGGGGGGGADGYYTAFTAYNGGSATATSGGSGASIYYVGGYNYYYGGCNSSSINLYSGSGGSGQSYSTTTGISSVSNLGNVSTNGEVTIQLYTPTITLTGPTTNSTTSNYLPTLTWTGNANYGGAITEYQVRAGTTSGGSDVLSATSTGTTTSKSITIPSGLTTTTKIYYSVRGYNASGGWSEWSDAETYFNFQPAYANPSSPADGSKFQNNYVDVSWGDAVISSGATLNRYEVRAGTTSGGINILAVTNNGTTKTKRIAVPAGTPGNTTIYWQVRVVDSIGYAGPWKESKVIYSNNVPKITGTGNTPANLDVSLEKRQHEFSVNSLIDSDDFNFVTLFADVLDKNGTVIPGSKKQIMLDSNLVNSASLISGTSTEKDGSLQGPINYTTPFNLKLYLEPDFTTGTFNLSLTKSDGVTNVLKSGGKLITNRAMQNSKDSNPENYTLRIYPEDRQNTNTLANNPLATVPDVTPISIPFTSDTRNYLPKLTNMKDDVADRIFSDSQGFNKISVTGHVDDSDPDDSVTIYYEVQPKASNYSIDVRTSNGKVIPANGIATESFEPKVDHDFSFIYQIDSAVESGNYALLVYGYDSQEGIGDIHEIPFTVDGGGPTIDFTADYLASDKKTIILSTAQKQIIAEFNKSKLYFTPNNYATFEYAGYLIRDGAAKDLRIRGAFTNEVKATFIGVDFGQKTITLLNGEQTNFKLGDVIVFKFKATSSTGIVTKKDIRILIGDDSSTFTPLDDANLPEIP